MTTTITPLPVFQTPPDLFGRAWVNLAATAKLAQDAVWWIERHDDRGCWLVTQGGPALLASWVPDEPALIDLLPAMDEEPDFVFAIGDPDKRLDQLCRFLSKHWSKDRAAPGLDEYLRIRPGVSIDGSAQMSLTQDGGIFEPHSIAIWAASERYDVPGVNEPVPAWRSTLRTFAAADRQHIKLDPDVLKALSGVKGMAPARVTFGVGGTAKIEMAPLLGDAPHLVGYVLVGSREERKPVAPAEAASELRLIPQAFDGSKGWVDDIEGGDVDE